MANFDLKLQKRAISKVQCRIIIKDVPDLGQKQMALEFLVQFFTDIVIQIFSKSFWTVLGLKIAILGSKRIF